MPLLAEDRCGGQSVTAQATNRTYVSLQGTDSDSCGANAGTPCRSIQKGIAQAQSKCAGKSCSVLVHYGLYRPSTSVVLADGVDVYGGCVFGSEVDQGYQTVVRGNPAVKADGIKGATTVATLQLVAEDAVNPGESSVAMLVSNSLSGVLSITKSTLASGRGGTGASPGASAGSGGQAGSIPNGRTGGAGGAACSASPPAGGAGSGGNGSSFNNVSTSGCFALCKCSGNGNTAAQAGKDSGTAYAKGGNAAGNGGAGCDCGYFTGDAGNGGKGGAGNQGGCSDVVGQTNPDNIGQFEGAVWVANKGGNGGNGEVGSGGGGGGAGGYGANIDNRFNVTDFGGYPGGGGGGGGCGGNGGQGGQQGGASIPLVLYKATVLNLKTDVLIPGPGGQGGAGAPGGIGGTGGSGMTGTSGGQVHITSIGFCSGSAPGLGGAGGEGGQGGAGSGGAGGNGGPSFGVAVIGAPFLDRPSELTIYPAQPGSAGTGGVGAKNVQKKSDGKDTDKPCQGATAQGGGAGYFNNGSSILLFDGSGHRLTMQ